jgi:hypothetical protein
MTAKAVERPNILFIVADDASLHFSAAEGCSWIKTPNIDLLGVSGCIVHNMLNFLHFVSWPFVFPSAILRRLVVNPKRLELMR